ncbi:MAG: calcium-translocating P-type ATPase, PMCA-type [Clostridiaceae bacterium]|nr:calcium-translocating P-type ATPase, PMCA-type [Clostridiaceae bacterium]
MWHTKTIQEIENTLKTNLKEGINDQEAKKRLESFGKNKLNNKKKENIFIKFIKQFNDFMIIILIIAAIISAIVSKYNGSNDYMDSIIIIAIVIFNSIIGLIQETKAEKSLEALKKMTAPLAKVKRNGETMSISSEEVVPGDIILLEAGNYIPADGRLILSSNLKIEESSLTGETVPSLKDSNIVLKKEETIGDMINMVFSTTIVVNGHGEAIVTETGMNTKVGKIANMIIENKAPQTPIQNKLAKVGKLLGIVCLVICFVIFAIGIFKKIPIIEMFMTSVGLAVAAIPEGLPAIVTIVLSIGVTRMARKNAIIRKLPAVETLGSSNVICSDKTGTLTQNKMQVVDKFVFNEKNAKELIKYGCMCNDSQIEYKEGNKEVIGEPTENALINYALKYNIDKNNLYKIEERIKDIPFDSNRKMMSTIHKSENEYLIITKGAPEVIIQKCKYYKNEENIILMNNIIKDKIEEENSKMAQKALRVIAICYRKIQKQQNINMESIEQDLIFVGLVGMIDPPREGVKESILICKKAGIKTVMITGDHILTAKAIASELGILKASDKAITGIELDKIPQKELEKEIKNYSVFARVTPEHKVRIVKAFQNNGLIVAMTGDGVNDAPALKKADIGIAMGKNGTDVAKNAADMVLTDDNFITIVEAVKEGRNIYDNIRKAIHFLISTNIGEIVTIFMGIILGLKSPLLAIQLLWINLVTDSLPAIALGLESPELNIMNRKPIDSKKGLFSDGLWNKIFIEGTMIGMFTLFAFSLGNNLYGLEVGRTMAFVSLGLLELVHSFNIKSEESIFKNKIYENKYLIAAFILGTLMQVSVVVIKPIADVFKLIPLTFTQWIYTISISILPLIVIEIQKKFNELKFGKRVYLRDKKYEIKT